MWRGASSRLPPFGVTRAGHSEHITRGCYPIVQVTFALRRDASQRGKRWCARTVSTDGRNNKGGRASLAAAGTVDMSQPMIETAPGTSGNARGAGGHAQPGNGLHGAARPALRHVLDFEKPLAQLEQQIHELEALQASKGIDYSKELRQLRNNYTALLRKTYDHLSPWETVQVAREQLADRLPQVGDFLVNLMRRLLHGTGRPGLEQVGAVEEGTAQNVRQRCSHTAGRRQM